MAVDFTSVNLDLKVRDGGLQTPCTWTTFIGIYNE